MTDTERTELIAAFDRLAPTDQDKLIAWCQRLIAETMRQRLAAAVATRNRGTRSAGNAGYDRDDLC